MASRVTDGATLRKRRILELIAYIKSQNPNGVSVRDIQSFMMSRFGLKFDTTSKMIQELHAGGWITTDMSGKWFTTTKVEKMAKWLYGEE